MKDKISIIGLGYVGLPLAISFGKIFQTCGFDVDSNRVIQLQDGYDSTLEIPSKDLQNLSNLNFTSNSIELRDSNIYIVTVPTPVDEVDQPDFSYLISASEIVGKVIETGNIVIFESTVYPGATEEVCIPVIEKVSGLVFNKDFFAGYSPERINPGDAYHNLQNVIKIVSGSNENTSKKIQELYNQIIPAGTYLASSIRVAEAAKVIENIQRDLNIALVNEFSILFNKLNIDTLEVLKAAGTKWNFHNYRPGLVGGHCISVDPFYLTHKAKQVGYSPDLILAGRKLNDSMPRIVAENFVQSLLAKAINPINHTCLVLGVTFKENCPDTRNSGAIKLIESLLDYKVRIFVYDPYIESISFNNQNLEFVDLDFVKSGEYDSVIVAVGHKQFIPLENIIVKNTKAGILYDLKGLYSQDSIDFRL